MNFRYTGFISYRRIEWCIKCANFLNKILKEHVETYGSGIFLDKADIKGGHKIDERIAEGLYESMSLLFLFVPVSIMEDNPWCAWELSHFLEYEQLRIDKLKKQNPDLNENDCLQIIPVLIKGKREDLPPLLRNREYIDFTMEMLILRKNSRTVRKAYCEILAAFERIKGAFQGFENVPRLEMPPFDFEASVKKIGYQQPFPSMILKTQDDN